MTSNGGQTNLVFVGFNIGWGFRVLGFGAGPQGVFYSWGEATVDEETIRYCMEPEGEPEDCDPVEACEDYCHDKVARCIEETCQGGGELAPLEEELCGEGRSGDDGTEVTEGCVDMAMPMSTPPSPAAIHSRRGRDAWTRSCCAPSAAPM